MLGVGFSENVHFKEPLRCFSEELRTQLAAGSERTPAPTQLLQPPKPWTDELEVPKLNPPVPDPKPENPPLWVPKPEVCWDRDPNVGAF